MRLISNWKEVLKGAWSMRLMLLAAILSGLEVLLPFLEYYVDIPAGIFAGLSALVVAGAFVARLMAQKGITNGQ